MPVPCNGHSNYMMLFYDDIIYFPNCWGSLPPEAPYPEVTGAPATTTNPFHNLRLVCRSFCWFTGRRSLLKVHSRKGPIEGPLATCERRSKTPTTSDPKLTGHGPKNEMPQAPGTFEGPAEACRLRLREAYVT